MDAGGESRGKGRAPPYVSFRTFKTFIEDLNSVGVPPRIDPTVMQRVSGTVRGQLMTALRFLGLVDDADHATAKLRELAGAFGTDAWETTLGNILRDAYAGIFALDLGSISPGHLAEAFRPLASSEDVRRKNLVFFVAAAQDAGIPISRRVLDQMRRAPGAIGPRKRNGAVRRDAPAASPLPAANPGAAPFPVNGVGLPPAAKEPPGNKYALAFDALSECWDPDDMTPDVDQAFVAVLRHLRLKAAGKPTAPKSGERDAAPASA